MSNVSLNRQIAELKEYSEHLEQELDRYRRNMNAAYAYFQIVLNKNNPKKYHCTGIDDE